MDQKAFNERIAMSLLRQCAWVWEHCTTNPNEGEFNLTEVLQGLGRRGYKSKPGIVMVDMNQCECWDVFNSHLQSIDGLTYDRKTDEAVLEFDGFRCSYLLHDVLHLTARFCKATCPSMAQKVRFCYKDGERWTEAYHRPLPKGKGEKKLSPSTGEQGESPTFAELLRQVLLAA